MLSFISPLPLIIAGLTTLVIHIALVFGIYLIYARKQCTKAAMWKGAAIAGGCGTGIALLQFLLPEYLPPGCDLIATLMLIYHCGRSILKIERKPSLLATLTYFGVMLLATLSYDLLCWAMLLQH